jgi:5'-nucleotidase
MYRILIDQDSVLYDLSTVWYGEHNKEFPNHHLKAEDITGWNTQQVCDDNNCAANIYSYFNNPDVWSKGGILGRSNFVTYQWTHQLPVELGIVTTAANAMSTTHKVEWLQENFPHIPNIMIIVKAHIKHWVNGDILIDDGIHNVEKFTGIRILYGQPWNESAGDTYVTATGDTDEEKWINVDKMVRRAILLLDNGYSHATIEAILKDKIIQWE